VTTTTIYRPAVRDLLHILKFRSVADPAKVKKGLHLTQCWLSREDAGRYSLIVPAMYGPLDFLRLVNVSTVHEASVFGLVQLGDLMPMPVYNYGGAKYRWRTIQQGQPVTLTQRGTAAAR
jgi:hypothetical protein